MLGRSRGAGEQGDSKLVSFAVRNMDRTVQYSTVQYSGLWRVWTVDGVLGRGGRHSQTRKRYVHTVPLVQYSDLVTVRQLQCRAVQCRRGESCTVPCYSTHTVTVPRVNLPFTVLDWSGSGPQPPLDFAMPRSAALRPGGAVSPSRPPAGGRGGGGGVEVRYRGAWKLPR